MENLLEKECIQIMEEAKDWKDAIRIASTPLLKKGIINDCYIQAMMDTVLELGAYIVLAPNFALPHARGECGALKNGFSILKLKKPVYFDESEDSKAQFIMPIACVNNDNHMKMLQALAEVLGDPQILEQAIQSNDIDEIYNLFSNVKLGEE